MAWARSQLTVAFLFVLMSIPKSSTAHALDIGYADVRVEETRVEFKVSVRADQKLTGKDVESATIFYNNQACRRIGQIRIQRASERVIFENSFECTPATLRELRIVLEGLRGAPDGFELVGRAHLGAEEQVFTLNRARWQTRLNLLAPSGVLAFVQMGIHHIGAAPSEWIKRGKLHLPEGIDHILFLVALVLAGGGLKKTLGMVTGFTVGHSFTLALASFNWVSLPSRWVESAIALSIAYVAAENVWFKEPKHRWQIALGFGLVHGFGFATALRDAHLERSVMLKALLGFNLGVEVGQTLIVLLLLPLLFILRKLGWFNRYGTKLLSSGIFVIAGYWFFIRAF